MDKTPTIFLRAIVLIMGILVLALCIFVLPEGLVQELHTVLFPLVISMYVAAIPFFIALWQTLKLLDLIDKNKAFSLASVAALQRIKYCALFIGVVYTLGLPYFYYVAQGADAPGVMGIGLLLAGAPIVIAVFAAVLQKLLHSAIALKNENDLTV